MGPTLRTPLTIELWSYMFALMGICVAGVAYAMRSASWRLYLLSMALPSVALLLLSAGLLPATRQAADRVPARSLCNRRTATGHPQAIRACLLAGSDGRPMPDPWRPESP